MSNRISFIFYEKDHLPRYYEINKKIFRLTLYGIPAISLLCLAGILTMGIYIKKTLPLVPESKPVDNTPSQFLTKNKNLIEENQKLQELNQQLQTKLTHTLTSSQADSTWIKKVPDSKKRSHTHLAIENPEAFVKNKQIHFHFNLSNQLKNEVPLKGFVHVIMRKGNKLLFWPSTSLSPQKLTAPYDSGEAFSTRYFRPVKSYFPLPTETSSNTQEYLFVIDVYNTTGELIHREHITPTITGTQE